MQKLRSMRIYKKISQKKLAEILGCKSNTISQYEKGIRTPNAIVLKKLAEALNCKVDDLL